MTARDFAQTLELCERFGIAHTADRPPPRRAAARPRPAASPRARRRSCAGRCADARAAGGRRFDIALGHGSNDVTRRRRDRCASRARRCSTTSGRPSSTTSTAGSRARWSCPTRSRPSACSATARAASCAPTRGSRRSTTWPTSSPTRRCSTSSGSTARARSWSCARRRRSRSTTASRTTCSRDVLDAPARAAASEGVQPVVLPRTRAQRAELRAVPGFIVPEHAIDAQSLIAYADLVISAGGTMNREAVALGTPVYTTFEGRLGAVDERLIADGRLRKLATPARAAARQARRAGADPRVRRASGAARCSATARVLLELLLSAARQRLTISRNAPTDPLGGPSPPPPLAAAARRRRGAGRARVLPRLPAALRQRPDRPLRAPARTHDLVGARRAACSCSCCSRVYQRRWRYAGQRDYEAVVRAVVVIVLLTVVGIAVLRPVQRYCRARHHACATATSGCPTA